MKNSMSKKPNGISKAVAMDMEYLRKKSHNKITKAADAALSQPLLLGKELLEIGLDKIETLQDKQDDKSCSQRSNPRREEKPKLRGHSKDDHDAQNSESDVSLYSSDEEHKNGFLAGDRSEDSILSDERFESDVFNEEKDDDNELWKFIHADGRRPC